MDELERMDESLVELLVKLRKLEVFMSDLRPDVGADDRRETLDTIVSHREQLLESSRAVCERIDALAGEGYQSR